MVATKKESARTQPLNLNLDRVLAVIEANDGLIKPAAKELGCLQGSIYWVLKQADIAPASLRAAPQLHGTGEDPYQDSGCEVSSKCEECPMARCKHDDPALYQRWRTHQRDLTITLRLADLRKIGVLRAEEQVATEFKITAQTVALAGRRAADEQRRAEWQTPVALV